nr:STY0301 family protein [Aeromonas sp.]
MLLTTLALAASLQFDCPATIETRQQLLTPQQGWQAFTRDDDGKPDETLSHRLDNLALFDGDPAELASSNRIMATTTRSTTGASSIAA